MNVGILSAVDDEIVSASGEDNPVFTIARIRRDLGARNNAGFVFTDRTEGSSWNRVAGSSTEPWGSSRAARRTTGRRSA